MLRIDPDAERIDVENTNPRSSHLNHPRMLQCLQRALNHFPDRADHCRNLVLRVAKTHACRILHEGGLPERAIPKQSCHTRHDIAKREVFDHQLVGPKPRSEQANDVNADVGMTPDEIEQVGLRQERHRTVADRDGIRWLGLIVKRGDIGKCSGPVRRLSRGASRSVEHLAFASGITNHPGFWLG